MFCVMLVSFPNPEFIMQGIAQILRNNPETEVWREWKQTSFSSQPCAVKLTLLHSSFTPQQKAVDSPLLWDGEGSFHDILLHITLVAGYRHFISMYLEIMYSKNLCNHHFSEELQLFSCNEDKQMLVLFEMDENVTKDCLWSSRRVLNCCLESWGCLLPDYNTQTKCHLTLWTWMTFLKGSIKP